LSAYFSAAKLAAVAWYAETSSAWPMPQFPLPNKPPRRPPLQFPLPKSQPAVPMIPRVNPALPMPLDANSAIISESF
jgi:hypothetical protein